MEILYIFIFLIYIIIPILIIINIYSTKYDEIRKNRFKYGIASIITTILNIIIISNIFLVTDIDLLFRNMLILLIPIALLTISIVSYRIGKIKENAIYNELTKAEYQNLDIYNMSSSNTIDMNYLKKEDGKENKEVNVIDLNYLDKGNDIEKL